MDQIKNDNGKQRELNQDDLDKVIGGYKLPDSLPKPKPLPVDSFPIPCW